jgi:hypothetical protein
LNAQRVQEDLLSLAIPRNFPKTSFLVKIGSKKENPLFTFLAKITKNQNSRYLCRLCRGVFLIKNRQCQPSKKIEKKKSKKLQNPKKNRFAYFGITRSNFVLSASPPPFAST